MLHARLTQSVAKRLAAIMLASKVPTTAGGCNYQLKLCSLSLRNSLNFLFRRVMAAGVQYSAIGQHGRIDRRLPCTHCTLTNIHLQPPAEALVRLLTLLRFREGACLRTCCDPVLGRREPARCASPAAVFSAVAMTAANSMAAPGSNAGDLPSADAAEQPVSVAAEATPVGGEPSALPTLLRKAGRNRSNIRKRPAPDEAPDSAAGDTEGNGTSMMRPPKAQKAGAMAFTTKQTGDDAVRPFNFASSRALQQSTDQGATATLETETEFDRDARCALYANRQRCSRSLYACWLA